MKLWVALDITAISLLFIAAGLNDGEAPFAVVIAVGVLAVILLVVSENVRAKERRKDDSRSVRTWD